jgi:hypothetical protein
VIDDRLWHADTPASTSGWAALRSASPRAGLLPFLVDVGSGDGGPEEWELGLDEASYPGDHDAETVLMEAWDAWPGLAPDTALEADPDVRAAEAVASLLADTPRLKDPRLALAPVRRSADIPAAIGWSGAVNYEDDTGRLCAVLRSWEDRFGARLVALTYGELFLSVAAPPTTPAEAEAITDEHSAFSPDTTDDLTEYAERLIGSRIWSFWWD